MSETRPHPFAPIKVNLVESSYWKDKWEGAQWASDSGWEEFRQMDEDTLKGLIDEIASVPPKGKRKSKLDFSSEELEYLARQLSEQNEKLETTRQMITDAATWMYEAAVVPHDGDIEEAMEKAREDFLEETFSEDLWEPVYSGYVRKGPMEWSPRKKYEAAEILGQLAKQIQFKHKKGHLDRYLIFDFWDAPIVQELFSKYRGSPEAYRRLKADFERLADRYVKITLYRLDKITEDINVENRTDWRAAWKSMLASGEAPAAQRGMVQVLRDMPQEAEDA